MEGVVPVIEMCEVEDGFGVDDAVGLDSALGVAVVVGWDVALGRIGISNRRLDNSSRVASPIKSSAPPPRAAIFRKSLRLGIIHQMHIIKMTELNSTCNNSLWNRRQTSKWSGVLFYQNKLINRLVTVGFDIYFSQ